jgi:hypothetical protein
MLVWNSIIQIINWFKHLWSHIRRQICFNSHDSSSDHQYFFRSFDFIILRWRIQSESFRSNSSQFHEVSIFKFQNALVIHSYESNDLIVSDLNRLQKFSNHRECVVFSRMSVYKIHFDIKIDEMIYSIILIVFFIHRDEIVIDAIQWVIDRFFLSRSSRHYLMYFDQDTRLASIDRRCWIEIVNFDFVYLLDEMNNNFRLRVF